MSLSDLLRNAALGIALTLGCGQPENKFDRSFDNARERLEQQGIEVRGGLWNDEEGFARLVEYMRQDLDDLDSRRYGSGSCDEVSLSGYRESTFYCGPGAVQGNCNRVNPGDCLNQICYTHDGCYDDLLDEKNQLCIWSEQTRDCDEPFFREYGRCADNDNCGFYCQLIGAIAANLTAIEYGYGAVGPGCLWGGDYDQPRMRDEPKEKEPEYKNPRDKDPEEKEEKPKDESLRELCRNYYELGLRDCVDDPASPTELEEIIQGICYRPSLSSLEADRYRFECAYNTDCNEFLDCLNRG